MGVVGVVDDEPAYSLRWRCWRDVALRVTLRAGAAAAEAAPSHPLARHELELQAATVEVLCGDTTSARKRLDRLGPHPTIPDYLRLTEAVVDLAEGRPAQASRVPLRSGGDLGWEPDG